MRDTISALVRSIDPHDPLEREHITSALDWIASGAQLCRTGKPATPPIHLVSYFVLFDPRERQLLLVDHKKADLWLPSGGHVEPDEHPQATVDRELLEELRIVAPLLLPGPLFLTVTQTVGSTAGHTDVSLWYVLRGDCAQELRFDPQEFHGVAWFALDALPLDRADPHLSRFAAKLCAALAAPTSPHSTQMPLIRADEC